MIRTLFDKGAGLLRFDERALSPFERSYCQERINRHFSAVGWMALWAGVVFNGGALLGLDRIMLDQRTEGLLFHFHVAQLVLLLGFAAVGRRFPTGIRVWLDLNCLAITAAAALAVHENFAVVGVFSATLSAAFLGIACSSLMFLPCEGLLFTLMTFLYFGLAVGAAYESPVGRRWLPIAAVALLGAYTFHRVKSMFLKGTCLHDARTNVQMAPAHMVLRAAATGRPVEELFAPARRICACVFVSWQNYDALASSLPAEQLAELLTSYYHRCDLLLAAGIPDDAYFIDVQGDEMFIVIFDASDDEGSEAGIPAFRRAFHFARGLMEDAHAGRIGGDVRLDAGISFGDVLVGIVGPPGHRKTTGLGETPGRAARLKAAAGPLRAALGDRNRLVIDGKGVGSLSGEGIHTYRLPPGTKLRDLDDTTLHYWQRDVVREVAA